MCVGVRYGSGDGSGNLGHEALVKDEALAAAAATCTVYFHEYSQHV